MIKNKAITVANIFFEQQRRIKLMHILTQIPVHPQTILVDDLLPTP
jgi:hypothetical protein